MHVSEIWRYPVKSLRGERVPEVEVLESGFAGDRRIVVVSQRTRRLITARTRPKLLGLKAALDREGRITIDGFAWDSSEARKLVNEAARELVELVDLETDPRRFDVLPLLVATDGAVDTLGIDSRRLRPNIIVGGVPGIAERAWPGHGLRLGSIIIHAAQLRMRCVMTTYDPDTLQQDPGVLRYIVKKMEGKVALDCSVKTPGYVHENDAVEVLPLDNPQ